MDYQLSFLLSTIVFSRPATYTTGATLVLHWFSSSYFIRNTEGNYQRRLGSVLPWQEKLSTMLLKVAISNDTRIIYWVFPKSLAEHWWVQNDDIETHEMMSFLCRHILAMGQPYTHFIKVIVAHPVPNIENIGVLYWVFDSGLKVRSVPHCDEHLSSLLRFAWYLKIIWYCCII